MRAAIKNKDFETVAELTMRDSNNFHSVCRDTFPTINYMNETSDLIIKCVEYLNTIFLDEKVKESIVAIPKYIVNLFIKILSVLILSMLGRTPLRFT